MSSFVWAARMGEGLLGWVGPMIVATGAILLGVRLADWLLERRVSASVRMLLYGAVLARLFLPAAWQSPLGLLGLRRAGSVAAGDLDVTMFTVVPLEPEPASLGAGWALILYLTVAVLLLGRWLHARLALARRLRDASPLDRAVDGIPVVRHDVLGPLVAGLWRPTIVVPVALAVNQDEALDWVLCHERAHVRRRDLMVGALLQLSCILAWPVLPVWFAARRMRALMEVACDEQVVRGKDGAARRRYGEILLALAAPAAPAMAPVLSFGSSLKGRLRALAVRRRWPVYAQALVVAAVGTVFLACAGEPTEEEHAAPVADAQTDAPDGLTTAASGPSGTTPGATKQVTGSRPRFWLPPAQPDRAGVRPTLNGAPTPASLPAAAAKAPTAQGRASDGRFPARLWIGYDGVMWLYTRRGGSLRVGDAQPLEKAFRDAIAETGSRTLLIESSWTVPVAVVRRAMTAAEKAGMTDFALDTASDHLMRSFSRNSPPAVQLKEPVLTLTRGGEVYLDGRRVAPEALEEELRRELRHNGSETVLIRGDKDVYQDRSRDIMAIARRAGARNVAILSEPVAESDQAPAGKRGRLDPKLIVGAVRRHIGEITRCYEARLGARPGLAGRVVLNFTVAGDGSVSEPSVENSTLGDESAESCMVEAVRGWTFPKPEGGTVIVRYPFELTPGPTQLLQRPDQAITDKLKTYAGDVEECYARHLRVSSPGGKVVFRWTITPQGTVSHVNALGAGLEELAACVAKKLAGARFPRPPGISGPLMVEYPFYFAPGP